ncbi:MAG: hypothetical protein GEU97_06095 [Actinophytocola sp.]|nr:hypothetical protein [Actinophytocola sp.]
MTTTTTRSTTRSTRTATKKTREPTTSPATTHQTRVRNAILLPSYDSKETPATAAIDVGIVGDPDAGREGCVWLDFNGEHTAAQWPSGYQATFAPLAIYNEKGQVVWRAGQRLDIGGGESGTRIDRVPPECRDGSGDAFWIRGPLEPQ